MTAQQDAVAAASTALESAKTDLANVKSQQDTATAHARQIRAAIAQCQETLDAGGLTQGDIDAYLAGEAAAKSLADESKRVASLWQSAHDYEFQQVSGSAIGLLAMGVMMGKPKCAAVQNWIKGIWTVYYTRKATGSHDTDFSVAGSIPHTVPELMQELGV